MSKIDADVKKSDPNKVQPRKKGDVVFSAFLFILALFLLSQIRTEAKWIENLPLLRQPRFWPAMTLGGFLIFSAGNLIQSILNARQNRQMVSGVHILPWDELFNWVKTLEFAGYFLLYVFSIPYIGYLPATLLFCPLLTFRVGFRGFKYFTVSILAGFVIVFVFRTILSVKLPAGAIYNIFPDQIRNFLILYF